MKLDISVDYKAIHATAYLDDLYGKVMIVWGDEPAALGADFDETLRLMGTRKYKLERALEARRALSILFFKLKKLGVKKAYCVPSTARLEVLYAKYGWKHVGECLEGPLWEGSVDETYARL